MVASGRPGGKPVRKRTAAAQQRFLEQLAQNEEARQQRLTGLRKEASKQVKVEVLQCATTQPLPRCSPWRPVAHAFCDGRLCAGRSLRSPNRRRRSWPRAREQPPRAATPASSSDRSSSWRRSGRGRQPPPSASWRRASASPPRSPSTGASTALCLALCTAWARVAYHACVLQADGCFPCAGRCLGAAEAVRGKRRLCFLPKQSLRSACWRQVAHLRGGGRQLPSRPQQDRTSGGQGCFRHAGAAEHRPRQPRPWRRQACQQRARCCRTDAAKGRAEVLTIARVNVDYISLKRRLLCIIHRTLAVDAHERRSHCRISLLVLIRGITQREGTARAGVGRVAWLAISHRPFVAVVPGLLHGVPHASPPRIVRLLQIQIELVPGAAASLRLQENTKEAAALTRNPAGLGHPP